MQAERTNRLGGRTHEAVASGATLRAKACTTASLAGLLVELANADLFLDAAALDQLPKSPDRFLSGLFVTQCQLNHEGVAFRPWMGAFPKRRIAQSTLTRCKGTGKVTSAPQGVQPHKPVRRPAGAANSPQPAPAVFLGEDPRPTPRSPLAAGAAGGRYPPTHPSDCTTAAVPTRAAAPHRLGAPP